jgi:hypothetical protein
MLALRVRALTPSAGPWASVYEGAGVALETNVGGNMLALRALTMSVGPWASVYVGAGVALETNEGGLSLCKEP